MPGQDGSDAARKSFQVHGPFAGPQHVYPTEKRALTAARKLDAHLPKPGTSEHAFHVKMYGSSAHSVKPAASATAAPSKSLRLVSLDDYYASVVKAEKTRRATGRREDDEEEGRPKKFPRDLSPTARMKPVSDEDAMSSLRKERGTHSKKSLRWLAGLKAEAAYAKAGETAQPGVGSRGGAIGTLTAGAQGRSIRDARRGNSPGKDVTRFGITTVARKPSSQTHAERERIRSKILARHATAKSSRWLATLKALATGYSKVAGGGALKAANRGAALPLLGPSGRKAGKSGGHYRKRSSRSGPKFGPDGRPGPKSDKANFGKPRSTSLRRAMEAMAAPAGSAKPPKVYLPGVHNPKSPVRRAPGLKKPKLGGTPKPPAAAKPPTLTASLRPSTSSGKSPRVLDAGGAAELSNSLGIILANRGALAKAEHGFKAGALVIHNASGGSKDPGTIAAVGGRSTDTHVHIKTSARPGVMVHHSEVRAATSDDVKYHKKNVAKLHGLGLTKGITR